MSLILEALKKSEQQRRLGEAPTLGSPVLVARKRRNLLPLFGVLILAALAVGWWLMRTPEPDTGAPTVAGAPAPATAQPSAPPAKPAAPPHAPAGRPTPNANPATANRSPAPAPAASKPPVATAPTAPPAAAPKNPPAAPAAKPPAGPATPPVASTPAAPPATAPTRPAAEGKPATPNATVAPAPAPAPATARPAPAQPALPSVWDLPYATRKDLPELALTMHVYASAPADRFVVIKGERHGEGDDLGDGVTLKEIRADGMVLEFKGQRFVYPRDGR